MADNTGVDVKPIVSPSQMKNMWEQNILKKKQEVEDARKLPAQKVIQQQPIIKPQQTKPVPQESQIGKIADTKSNYSLQPTLNTIPPQSSNSSQTNQQGNSPIKLNQKTESAVDTSGMSLKERMKIWQQVTSSKSEGVPSPTVVNKPTHQVTKPNIIPSVQTPQSQNKPIEQPKPVFVTPSFPPPPPPQEHIKQPTIQTVPSGVTSQSVNQATSGGGVETSFVPASKRIGLWQNKLNKNNSEAQKAKQESVLLTQAKSRLSYQPQSYSNNNQVNERSTFATGSSSSQLNLQQILGTKQQEKPPVDAFHKKNSEPEPQGEKILSVKQRMKMMQQSLEKNMKQKQQYTFVKPIPQQPVHQIHQEPAQTKEFSNSNAEVDPAPTTPQQQTNFSVPTPGPENTVQVPSVQHTKEQAPKIEQTANTQSEFQSLMARQARMKNRRTKVDFDDA